MKKILSLLITTLTVIFISSEVSGSSTFYGPLPYLSFADSPFNGIGYKYFYLEDFEDGQFNVPGVTALNNNPGQRLGVIFPNFYADSVDGDDGVIDGLGRYGHSFGDADNLPAENLGYTFIFDSNVLGGLPTHVGIVWTDGSPTASTQFEAYGPDNEYLGIIGPVKISDNSFAGTTGEDRFFGVINDTGISKFVIRSPGSNTSLEVDHLQYGIVPEPVSSLLFVTGAMFLAGRRYIINRKEVK